MSVKGQHGEEKTGCAIAGLYKDWPIFAISRETRTGNDVVGVYAGTNVGKECVGAGPARRDTNQITVAHRAERKARHQGGACWRAWPVPAPPNGIFDTRRSGYDESLLALLVLAMAFRDFRDFRAFWAFAVGIE